MPPNSQQQLNNNQAPGNNPAPFANYVTPEVIAGPPSRKKKIMVMLAAAIVLILGVLALLVSSGAINLNPDQTRRENLAAVANSIAQFRETEGYIPFDFEIDANWDEISPNVTDPSTGQKYELIILDDTPEIGQISYRKTADYDFEICTKLESTDETYCLTNPKTEADDSIPTIDSTDDSQN